MSRQRALEKPWWVQRSIDNNRQQYLGNNVSNFNYSVDKTTYEHKTPILNIGKKITIYALPIMLLTSLASASCTQKLPEQPNIIVNQPEDPVSKYASEKGLQIYIPKLTPLKSNGLDENEKTFIDYISDIPKTEVISPEVLKLASPTYRDEVVKSLQEKVIDNLIPDGISPDEANALKYISNFSGDIQRDYIESGIDGTMVKYLALNSSLKDQNFARNAVISRLGISLTNPETEFLKDPSQTNLEKLLASYESELYNYPDIGPALLKKIQELPEYKKDSTTVEVMGDMTNLLKYATSPEVKEAFELMIKGGTPDPSDYKYTVPNYNTELHVLYKLAGQNELKKNDTLVLAIAAVNGLWDTMGDDEVREAVYRDTNTMLNFGRETSELQKAIGLPYNLEEYSLEAKVCWAWTGGDPGRGGHYIIYYQYSGKRIDNPTGKAVNLHPLIEYKENKIDIKGYLWNTIDPENLPRMRKLVLENWFDNNSYKTSENIEYFFSNNLVNGQWIGDNWVYTSPDDDFIIVDGEKTINHNMNNADFELEYFIKTGKGIGVCDDNATFINALLKSVGIVSNIMIRTWSDGPSSSHTHNFLYIPHKNIWTVWQPSLYYASEKSKWNENLVRPPINLKGYLSTHRDNIQPYYDRMLDSYYLISETSPKAIQKLFYNGIDSSKMKLWLLYR